MSEERKIGSGSGMGADGKWFPGEGESLLGTTIEAEVVRAFTVPNTGAAGRRLALGLQLTAPLGEHKVGDLILVSEKACMRPLRDVAIGTVVRVAFDKKQQNLKDGRKAYQAEIFAVKDGEGVKVREAAMQGLESDTLDQKLAGAPF